jgi:murein L,D-transpeptidase YcbB/YkuD
MLKYFFCLFFGVIFLSGCVIGATTAKSPALSKNCPETMAASQRLNCLANKVSGLETELKKAQSSSVAYKEELAKKVEESQALKEQLKNTVRMPSGEEIQKCLKKAGVYPGPIDGEIGQTTKDAISKFQQANGLTPDGVVGSKTWEKLRQYWE